MFENKIPLCPRCKVTDYVVLINTTQKAGTLVGGVAGAASGFAGAEIWTATGAVLGSFVPIVGTGIGAVTGGLAGAIAGFFAGATIGNRVGQHIDIEVIGRYRCNKCRTEFEV
jgi:hypothetical protein